MNLKQLTIGYRLRPGFDLPPLMFTLEEVISLRVGARLVQTWADPDLVKAAASALARLDRMRHLEVLAERFEPTPGRTLPDLIAKLREDS